MAVARPSPSPHSLTVPQHRPFYDDVGSDKTKLQAYHAFWTACAEGNVERCAELLLDTRVPLDVNLAPPAAWSLSRNELSVGQCPLLLACRAGSAKTVKLLIRKGADGSVCTQSTKETALHNAVASRDLETAKVLAAKGAALNIRDLNGRTPAYCGEFAPSPSPSHAL